MRRQLKPFVTEYRGGTRRGKDGSSPETQAEPSRNRAFEEAQRVFQPEPAEDSYEAALRAADALFSRAPSMPAASPRPPAPVETSEPPDPFAAEPLAGPGSTAADAIPVATIEGPHQKSIETQAPRRILQAIEPPNEDRFAALEAERAPKRRGRKPGSKNKPKVLIGDDWPAAAEPAALAIAGHAAAAANDDRAAVDLARRDLVHVHVAPDDRSIEAAADEEELLVADVFVANGDDPSEPAQPRGRTDKFNRRRGTELRPGERWKRRLPKAAW